MKSCFNYFYNIFLYNYTVHFIAKLFKTTTFFHVVNTSPRVIQLSCFHQWEVYICVNGPIISLDNCRPAFVYRIQKLTKYQTLTHSFKSMPRSYVQIMTWFIYKLHKLSFGNHFYCNRKKIVGCIKLLCNWTGCLLGKLRWSTLLLVESTGSTAS